MSDIGSIKVFPEQIAHLLSDGYWSVPRYQRGYKWTERQVLDLFTDIESAIQEKQAEYFVGSIVVSNAAGDRPEIVDGQQRLATISIFLAAIRDYFQTELKDPDTAKLYQSKYLLEQEVESKDWVPKLQLSETDHNFFLRKILEPPSKDRSAIKPQKDSHERMLDAYKLARLHLTKITSGINKPESVLHERVRYLLKNTLVILVRVPSDQNAFTIFETLNDRGLDLAITDLLKNFLFGRSQDRIKEVQQRWSEMITTIETSVSEESVKDYLRHQWSSTHGLTRERELFQQIKATITNKSLAVQYVETLRLEAVLFAAIHNGSQEFWKGYTTSDKQYVQLITEVLGLEQRITPLLLAVLAKFSKKEVSGSLKMIVGWGVRILVGHSVAGQLERKYSDASVKIRQESIKTAKELYVFMKDVIPSDADFVKAFQEAKVPKAYIARYYLRALERSHLGQADPELVPNDNETEVNLEHVLPQNRNPGTWKNFSDEAHESYRFRLGNLALMKVSENGNAGNEEFAEKRPIYAKSSLALTSSISKVAAWDEVAIAARQQMLATFAVATWPSKPK